MRMRTWAVPVLAVSLLIFSSWQSSCAKPQAQQTNDPSALVMKECTACHAIDRVCSNLGKKDRDAWMKTVSGMVDKGAGVPKENIPAVAEYLASLKPGSPPVCK